MKNELKTSTSKKKIIHLCLMTSEGEKLVTKPKGLIVVAISITSHHNVIHLHYILTNQKE
jgi:hypothetical protein